MFVDIDGQIFFVRESGGPGSGNWGHLGIPGYHGGSQAGSGGVHARPENYKEKKGITSKSDGDLKDSTYTIINDTFPLKSYDNITDKEIKDIASDINKNGPSGSFDRWQQQVWAVESAYNTAQSKVEGMSRGHLRSGYEEKAKVLGKIVALLKQPSA